MALAQLATGNEEAARRGLREVLERNPAHHNAAATLGMHLVANSESTDAELDEAEELLQRALDQGPGGHRQESADIAFHLGIARLKRGRYAAGATAFERTLELHPAHAKAREALDLVINQLAAESAAQGVQGSQRPPPPPSPGAPAPGGGTRMSMSTRLSSDERHSAAAGLLEGHSSPVHSRHKAVHSEEDSLQTVARLGSHMRRTTDQIAFVQMTFELADLQFPGPYPEGIDVSKRETYLSPEDFEANFGMDLEAFQALPLWKRKAKKQQLKLW